MIFVLFLGGYLLPKSQYRISEQREYIIYQALCRNQILDTLDTNISLVNSSIPLTNNKGDLDNKVKTINDLLKKKSIIKAQDYFGYKNWEDNKRKIQSQGLTGDSTVDKLLRLHRLLSKYDIIQ